MTFVKAFYWRLFYYLENLCDWLAGKFDVFPLHWVASWVGTIAIMMDDELMHSLRVAMAQAQSSHHRAYTHEEVFGAKLVDDGGEVSGTEWLEYYGGDIW